MGKVRYSNVTQSSVGVCLFLTSSRVSEANELCVKCRCVLLISWKFNLHLRKYMLCDKWGNCDPMRFYFPIRAVWEMRHWTWTPGQMVDRDVIKIARVESSTDSCRRFAPFNPSVINFYAEANDRPTVAVAYLPIAVTRNPQISPAYKPRRERKENKR